MPSTRGKQPRRVVSPARAQDGTKLSRPLDAADAAVAADLATHAARTDNPHAVTAAQAGAVATSRQVISGAGLTGGGDLSADRTLAVGAGTGIVVGANDVAADFGTGAGKVTQGNDARLTDARTPTAHDVDDPTYHGGATGAVEDNLVAFDSNGLPKDTGIASADVLQVNAVSGSFTTVDGKTITVVDGQITAIV